MKNKELFEVYLEAYKTVDSTIRDIDVEEKNEEIAKLKKEIKDAEKAIRETEIYKGINTKRFEQIIKPHQETIKNNEAQVRKLEEEQEKIADNRKQVETLKEHKKTIRNNARKDKDAKIAELEASLENEELTSLREELSAILEDEEKNPKKVKDSKYKEYLENKINDLEQGLNKDGILKKIKQINEDYKELLFTFGKIDRGEEVKQTKKEVENEKVETEKAEEKPTEEKPTEEKPTEEKPAEEKPAEEKPAEENPVIGRQAEGLIKRVQARKLAEESPVQEPPVQESPVQEPPVQESPVQEPPVQEPPAQEPPVQTPPTPKGTYNEVHKRMEEEVEKIYNDNKENIDKTFKEHSIEELRKGYSIDEIANDLDISLSAAILLRRKILQDHPELAEQNNEKDPNKKEKSNIWEKIKKGMKSAKEFIVNSKVGSAVINFFKNIPGNVKMLTAGKEKNNSVNELVTRMENACKANKNKEFRDSMKPSQKYTEAYERLNSCSTIKELEEVRKELLETNPKDRSIIEEAYDSIVLDSDKTFEDEEQLKD